MKKYILSVVAIALIVGVSFASIYKYEHRKPVIVITNQVTASQQKKNDALVQAKAVGAVQSQVNALVIKNHDLCAFVAAAKLKLVDPTLCQ